MRSLSRVAGLHLLANAILLSAGYYWLGVSESRTSTLLGSIFLALFLLLFGAWAYSVPLAWFRKTGEPEIRKTWVETLRNLLPLALAALALAAIVIVLNRPPAMPLSPLKKWALRLGEWVVLPVLFLPMLSAVSERGWQGFRSAGSGVTNWWFWVAAPLLMILTLRVPLLLLNWIPHVRSFTLQAVSFTLRAALAYLIFGGGWLLLAFVTSSGTPRFTQSSTADSP